MINNKQKKVFTTLTVVTGCISTYAFASLFGIPTGIKSSAIGLKISAITAEIKNYKSIIKQKKKKKCHKIVLLAKSKLNDIVVLISKALIQILAMMNLF